MAVVLMVEWDNAKDESRYKRYGVLSRSLRGQAFFDKKVEEGIAKKWSNWSDNTGHIILWVEFEDMDAFAKVWADEEYHKFFMELNPLVDNLRFHLLRRAVVIPEE